MERPQPTGEVEVGQHVHIAHDAATFSYGGDAVHGGQVVKVYGTEADVRFWTSLEDGGEGFSVLTFPLSELTPCDAALSGAGGGVCSACDGDNATGVEPGAGGGYTEAEASLLARFFDSFRIEFSAWDENDRPTLRLARRALAAVSRPPVGEQATVERIVEWLRERSTNAQKHTPISALALGKAAADLEAIGVPSSAGEDGSA